MLGAIVTTAVPAVAVGVAAGAWRQSRALVMRTCNSLRLDHGTAYAGPWQVTFPPQGSEEAVRIRLVCAPSRSFRRHWFDTDVALKLAKSFMGPECEIAHLSLSAGLHAETGTPDERDFLWLASNGQVDLSLAIPIARPIDDDHRSLDVVELLGPIARVYDLVHSVSYRELHHLRPWRSWQRFDWRIGVSTWSPSRARGSVSSWTHLVFPGAQPERATKGQTAFCPAEGYGTRQLRGRFGRRPNLAQVMTVFVTDLLRENGYHRETTPVAEAVGAVVAAHRSANSQSRLLRAADQPNI